MGISLQAYIDSKAKVKPNSDIIERWHTRILAQGMVGASGARTYLENYGKGISAEKVVKLARQAMNEGDSQMADIFWRVAYKLEFGEEAVGIGVADIQVSRGLKVDLFDNMPDFPDDMQPTNFVTMQPVDGQREMNYYCATSRYVGMPKRDGKKVLVFATPRKRVYRTGRSFTDHGKPSNEFDAALETVANNIGAFLLEGELYYQDVLGGEHRTSAQAATVNVGNGDGIVQPGMRFLPFTALFANSIDFRTRTYARRVEVAQEITKWLEKESPIFEYPVLYDTTDDKRQLCLKQKSENREGMIWADRTLPYSPGKLKNDLFVRTKFLLQTQVIVTGLTKTTAEGRLFGAIEVTDMNGKPLGHLGSGFTTAEQKSIITKFEESKRTGVRLVLPVIFQQYTETGKIFQARLDDEYDENEGE